MSMQEDARQCAPDTYGLPEFFVTDITTEIMGANVRLICGARHGTDVQWRYTVVLPAEMLIDIGKQCLAAGQEALLTQMMDQRKAH